MGDFHPHANWAARVRRFEETFGAANRVEVVQRWKKSRIETVNALKGLGLGLEPWNP